MKRKDLIYLMIAFFLIIILMDTFFLFYSKNKQKMTDDSYNPVINPSDFSSNVDNPFFTLTPGRTYTYQGKTDEGIEKNIVIVTGNTREILGVTNIEVWDRVWLDDELIEETFDWYAQDKEGNVWYFGEDSKEYENGKVSSTEGSWEAGADGAKPGIIMKANPQVGDSYRQEYLRGEAEDLADVLALDESVSVAYGSFDKCIKTYDWSMIDSDLREYKYYCADVGNVVLETAVGSDERVELIDFKR